MQAGRWKTTVMPMGYGEEVLAAQGMARKANRKEARSKNLLFLFCSTFKLLQQKSAMLMGKRAMDRRIVNEGFRD
jgi:hypothetical protein